MAGIFSRVRFLAVDDEPYRRFRGITPPRLHSALLKLETFNLHRHGLGPYASVVFLDADLLCLGDIGPLLALEAPFAACPAGRDLARKERLKNRLHWRVGFNSGVMVIGSRHLDGRTHRRLLHSRVRSCPTGDQDILNRFFRLRPIFCLDPRYNCHAEFFWTPEATDVRLLHYAGDKPLARPDLPRMRPWFDYRERMRRHLAERGRPG